MTISPGEFWLANIPYTDQSARKIRSVLVLWLDAADAVVAAVTSAQPRTTTDVPLADWQPSGLRLASTVRLSRLDCLEQSLLLHRLGAISSRDANQLKAIWGMHIKPNF
jgi:mRNA interferase MazF